MFELNKWYKLDKPEMFSRESMYNAAIAEFIGTNPFKIDSIEGDGSVTSIFFNNKIYNGEDIEKDLSIILTSDEYEFFEEIENISSYKEEVENKELIAVFIEGEAKTIVGPLIKKELDTKIKKFLSDNNQRIVKIFEYTANASVSVYYEDVK
ncbi:hypothetical protein [Proteus phage PM2]|uniref:Uncharacterized protein n=1 Tax=Proteus phage PM2 TaxID=2025809 RepID=A0A249XX10_9CAUD|nr:hypothetical protein KNT71_gp170 [Proteus phage PM2]ASZ76462.1 hypothetical protein [Proteus phage PM2]